MKVYTDPPRPVTQQQSCYAAERSLDHGRIFSSVDEVQRYVDALRDNQWWHAQGFSLHVLRIEVGKMDGRKNKRAAGVGWFQPETNAGRIELRHSCMYESVVLHEVAHVLAAAVHGSTCHDPAWARTFLTLVSAVMGPDAYLTLQRSFDAFNVRYDVETRAASSVFAL